MRVTRSHTLQFASPIEQVFPLFSPIKEKLWAHDWDPTLVHSETDSAEEKGAVFTVQHPNGRSAVWVVSHYDPAAHRIEYVMVLPDSHVTLITVHCTGKEKTAVNVSYTVTALSEAGQAYVQSFTEADFQHHRMASWQRAIDHYLQTGNVLAEA